MDPFEIKVPRVKDIRFKISEISDKRRNKVKQAAIIDKIYRIIVAVVSLLIDYFLLTQKWQEILLAFVIFTLDIFVSNGIEKYISSRSSESITIKKINTMLEENEMRYELLISQPHLNYPMYLDYIKKMSNLQKYLDDSYAKM